MPALLLVDDHPLVQVALEAALQKSAFSWLVTSVEDDVQAMASLSEQQFALVVLDIGLPQVDGLQLMRRMLRHYPELRVLIYTAQEEEVYARLAFNAGASGFVSKGRSMPQLIAAIDALSQGKRSFPDFINLCQQEEVEESLALTPKELQVIGLLSQGLSNVQIADMLNISNKTVSTHKNTILRKTGAKNLFELAAVYKELQQ
ncbi:response regulator [Ewingella americana]|uniref:response regulator n=1 Tax=Ewingella americana TaxID=41202 RepID=UPI00163A6109|nr:response regulator transcription factor [Ewingella americana]QMV52473.1 response regulator transcription factor [Ewingella americana]